MSINNEITSLVDRCSLRIQKFCPEIKFLLAIAPWLVDESERRERNFLYSYRWHHFERKMISQSEYLTIYYIRKFAYQDKLLLNRESRLSTILNRKKEIAVNVHHQQCKLLIESTFRCYNCFGKPLPRRKRRQRKNIWNFIRSNAYPDLCIYCYYRHRKEYSKKDWLIDFNKEAEISIRSWDQSHFCQAVLQYNSEKMETITLPIKRLNYKTCGNKFE